MAQLTHIKEQISGMTKAVFSLFSLKVISVIPTYAEWLGMETAVIWHFILRDVKSYPWHSGIKLWEGVYAENFFSNCFWQEKNYR